MTEQVIGAGASGTSTRQPKHLSQPVPSGERLLLIDEVMRRTADSRSTIANKLAAGQFPQPLPRRNQRLPRKWVQSDIDRYVAEIIEQARGAGDA